MPVRNCRVTFKRSNDEIEHVVTVSASSVYEAIAAGIAAMRRSSWSDLVQDFHRVTVEVLEAPIAQHVVEIAKFYEWLERSVRSPRDVTERNEVKKALYG